MDDVISLGVGEPDFATPWGIREAAIHSVERGHTHYTSNHGLFELRRMLSDDLKRRYDLEYDPNDELLITVGVSEGLDLAMRAILDPGDGVIVPEPSYVSYAPCVTLAGGTVVPVATTEENGFRVTAEQVEQAAVTAPPGPAGAPGGATPPSVPPTRGGRLKVSLPQGEGGSGLSPGGGDEREGRGGGRSGLSPLVGEMRERGRGGEVAPPPGPADAPGGATPPSVPPTRGGRLNVKALVLSYPNNPTGAVLSRDELLAIADVAERRDLIVISDEVYDRLVYQHTHTSFASLPGMRERTVLLGGFSKSHAMTGWRVAFAAAPPEILGAMVKIHQYTMLCAPGPSQAAAIEALKTDDRVVDDMVTAYNHRRRLLVKGLNDMGLRCFEPRGAFYAFPSIKATGLSSDEFAESLLKEERVAVVPGSAFGAAGEGYVRCCYAVSTGEIEEALERMRRFVRRRA